MLYDLLENHLLPHKSKVPESGAAASVDATSVSGTTGSRSSSSIIPIIPKCRFHRNRVRLDEVDTHQRQKPEVKRSGFCEVPGKAKPDHFREFTGNLVGNDRDNPIGAECGIRQCDCVISRPETEAGRPVPQDLHHLADISGRFLNSGDVRKFCNPQCCFGFDIAGRPARNVIHNHRRIDGVRDRFVVLEQSLLRRLIIVRGNDQNSVGACGKNALRKGDRLSRGIAARTGNDRNRAEEGPNPCDLEVGWQTAHQCTNRCVSTGPFVRRPSDEKHSLERR